jgi:hypothetical protein
LPTSTRREPGFRLGPALLAPPLPRKGGYFRLVTAVLQEVVELWGHHEFWGHHM